MNKLKEETVKNAKELLKDIRLEDVVTISAGAATFYSWVSTMDFNQFVANVLFHPYESAFNFRGIRCFVSLSLHISMKSCKQMASHRYDAEFCCV